MADEADKAQMMYSAHFDLARKNAQMAVANLSTRNESGYCWHCGKETGHDRRWCNSVCRDEWEEEQ